MKELIVRDSKDNVYKVKLDDKDFESIKDFKWHARRTRFDKVTFFVDKHDVPRTLDKWFGFDLNDRHYHRLSLNNLIIIKLWGVEYYHKGCSLIFRNDDFTDFRRENITIRGSVAQRTDEEIDNFVEPKEFKPRKEVRQYTFGNDWSRPMISEDGPKFPTPMRDAMRKLHNSFHYACPPLITNNNSFLFIKAHNSDKSESGHILFKDIDDLAQFLRFNDLSDMLEGGYIGSLSRYKLVLRRCVAYGIYVIEIDKPKDEVERYLDMNVLCKYIDTLLHLSEDERIERIKGIIDFMMFRGGELDVQFRRVNK